MTHTTSPPLPRRRLAGLALAPLAAPGAAAQQAGGYPDRPVRVVVGFPPGGATDSAVRPMQNRLSALLGQPVVIENRPGAGSTLAAELVVRAAPDGHTVLLGTIGVLAIGRLLNPALAYDAERDFAPVASVVSVVSVLVVPADRPWRSVADLVAAARARPGALSWGDSGIGTSGHMAGALLDHLAGLRTVRVPYRGGGPLMTDLLAGRIDYAFSTAPPAIPHVETGRLRALAVPHRRRSPALPEVPTMEEAGVPGYAVENWYGLVVPAGTPPAAIARLAAAVRATQDDPEVVAAWLRAGLEPLPGGPEELARRMREAREQWEPIVRATGATVN
ncbi:Bug family tripartite tricarboxylate transporter substrate binding protein [Caldovatus aquaticus]|uniref:Tripartite tricarboxylate transporter substrate binding protein n=1 Tax=Caldovatus aquaticus TaxID=2865671 RepID=A0ABS7F575_9PROT|nr:tripartite tricarboxylate transporter substrate binding protein [Caldovatus aquaticus]MBW8270785.1 tripartite tricarboxylate transporter substrate binding protein [Caldovatus aquaticus]